jgi:hypothetical protein
MHCQGGIMWVCVGCVGSTKKVMDGGMKIGFYATRKELNKNNNFCAEN